MSHLPEDPERERLLRDYLLAVLSHAEAGIVEGKLAESEAWRDELERQRTHLALLDSLPAAEPPPGLAARVSRAVQERQGAPEDTRASRRRFAWQLAAACLVFAVGVAFVLPALSRAREAARCASTQNNLKQLGLVLKMYANEDPRGTYPPLTPYRGLWMFDVQRVYPEYLTDLGVLVNLSLPDAPALEKRMKELQSQRPINWEEVTRIAAKGFVYTGWSVASDDQARELREEVPKLASTDFGKDLQTPAGTIRRTREGIERFMITDINNPAGSASAQASLPVMFEADAAQINRYRNPGISVLYMDGHVAYVPEGSRFPATPTVRHLFAPAEEAEDPLGR